MKHDYTELDAAILERIGRGDCPTFTQIDAGECAREADKIVDACKSQGLPPREIPIAFRLVDRRLQAMRRAGKIRYTGKGWALA